MRKFCQIIENHTEYTIHFLFVVFFVSKPFNELRSIRFILLSLLFRCICIIRMVEWETTCILTPCNKLNESTPIYLAHPHSPSLSGELNFSVWFIYNHFWQTTTSPCPYVCACECACINVMKRLRWWKEIQISRHKSVVSDI